MGSGVHVKVGMRVGGGLYWPGVVSVPPMGGVLVANGVMLGRTVGVNGSVCVAVGALGDTCPSLPGVSVI